MTVLWTAPCFFSCSVAYTIAWTAVSSLLAHYKMEFGKQILLQLNIAFFLPSVPILLTQSWCDDSLNRRYGVATATSVRLCIGLGGCAAVSAIYPFFSDSHAWLLLMVVFLGMFSGLAFGSSYQLVSKFPAKNSVALTLGYVGSGPIVLLIEGVIRAGPQLSWAQLVILFELVAALTLCGLGASLLLLRRFWDKLEAPGASDDDEVDTGSPSAALLPRSSTVERRHKSNARSRVPGPGGAPSGADEGAPPSQAGLLDAPEQQWRAAGRPDFALDIVTPSTSRPSSNSSQASSRSAASSVDIQELFYSIWPAAVSLYLSIGTSILVFPFFLYVPSSGQLGMMLPQVMFGARVITDIIGRVLPRPGFMMTKPAILVLGIVKAGMTPLFFMGFLGTDTSSNPALLSVYGRHAAVRSTTNMRQQGFYNDYFIVAWVALFWLLSGYSNTLALILAPAWAPHSAKLRSGVVMTFVFQASCVTALVLACALEEWHSLFGLY